MIRLCYITQLNFQSGRAHVYNVAKTCEALQKGGKINVTLVSTDRSAKSETAQQVFFRSHRVATPFRIVSLESFRNAIGGRAGAIFSNVTLARFVMRNRDSMDVVYFRDHLLLPVMLVAKYVFKKGII